MATVPNYYEALARAREAKRIREAKLAAEVVEIADLPELIIDGEYESLSPVASDEQVFNKEFWAELFNPAPIKATVIPAVNIPIGYTAIYGSILRETEKAALFSVKQPTPTDPDRKVQWWIPLSQVWYIQRSSHHVPYRDLIHVKSWVLNNHGYKANQFTQA